MTQKEEVLIIGAGPGGLTAGMLLQHHGYQVKILEKAERVGGRNARIELGDFKFDTGPTFLMMKFILDEMFAAVGRRTEDYLQTVKLDPMYKLYFPEFNLDIRTDLREMKEDIARLFPGEEKGIDKFIEKETKRYERLLPCLQIPYSEPKSMISKHMPGLEDIDGMIEEELIISPQDWQNKYNVYFGATFNLAHSLDQMLYLRPRNKFEELENCYLVGGGTHPGSGLPTIYESARISVNLLTGLEI